MSINDGYVFYLLLVCIYTDVRRKWLTWRNLLNDNFCFDPHLRPKVSSEDHRTRITKLCLLYLNLNYYLSYTFVFKWNHIAYDLLSDSQVEIHARHSVLFAMTASSIDTCISSLDIIIYFSELDCHVLLPKRKYYFLIKYSVIREIYSLERRVWSLLLLSWHFYI